MLCNEKNVKHAHIHFIFRFLYNVLEVYTIFDSYGVSTRWLTIFYNELSINYRQLTNHLKSIPREQTRSEKVSFFIVFYLEFYFVKLILIYCIEFIEISLNTLKCRSWLNVRKIFVKIFTQKVINGYYSWYKYENIKL